MNNLLPGSLSAANQIPQGSATTAKKKKTKATRPEKLDAVDALFKGVMTGKPNDTRQHNERYHTETYRLWWSPDEEDGAYWLIRETVPKLNKKGWQNGYRTPNERVELVRVLSADERYVAAKYVRDTGTWQIPYCPEPDELMLIRLMM